MIKIKDVVMDTAGNGVHNVTVTITHYPSGAAATLYSDNGVTPLLGNSVLTDELGQYEFYIPNGRYTRTVSKTGATTVVDEDVINANDGAGISVSNGKTFAVLNSLTLAGTDGTTITLPSSSSALAGIAGAQTFTGLQTFANGLTSAGTTTISDTLTVTGPTALTTLSTSSNASVTGTLGVTGATTLSSLNVTGATTLNSLTLSGAFSPTQVTTGSVTSSGLSSFNAGLEATTIETSGAATLSSAIVTTNATVGGTLGVTGLATFNNISATQDVSVGDALTVTGAATVGTTLGVTGTATMAAVNATNISASGTLSVTGAASFNGKTLSLAGNLTTAGAFASTFTMTGVTSVTFPTSGTLISTDTLTLASLPSGGGAEGNVLTLTGGVWGPAAPSGGSGGAGSFTTLTNTGDATLATNGSAANFVYIGNTTAQTGMRLYGRGSGSAPRIEAFGFDSSIDLTYSSKLTGGHKFYTRSFSGTGLQFQITDTFSADNYLSVTGADTATPPTMSALGADTNIDARIIGKGTGGLSTNKLKITEGSNATMGVTGAMTAGSITVSTTAVTASSRIFLTAQSTGGTAGALRVSARTAGTSFTITSTSGSDTSTVAWMIVEPA